MTTPPRRVRVVGAVQPGREELAAGLRARAAALADRTEVEFTGHVADPAPAMAAADVLVHCSTMPEPFGQVVVEGMQQGCVVVAADSGGPTEIVTPGVDGELHRTGDAADLARILDALVGDPERRERLAAAGRRTARGFELPAQAESFVRLVAQVLAGEGRSRARRRR